MTEIKTPEDRVIDQPADGNWPTEEPHTTRNGDGTVTTKGDGNWPTEEPDVTKDED